MLWINWAAEKINNISTDQVVGKRVEDLVREGLYEQSVTLEVLDKRTTVNLIQYLKGGKQLLVTGNPVFDEQGEISLVILNDRDITALNRLRRELEDSRALARGYQSEITQLQNQNALMSKVIIGSKVMRRVFHTAMKVAQVDSTVLIRGESGVGKSLFAKIIHQASQHQEGPFIRVDCGSIPETLLESELFGYEKGAFTGAGAKGKLGHFELAQSGTLFLDEVGELPFNMQVKLLRFLEEKEIVRVGGTTAREINARVIAATNRNLEEMVEKAGFRRDLFFRLSVIPIGIPPLRERIEDIPPLIDYFRKRFNRKCATNKVIMPSVIDYLCGYAFPGNIRELANLVEQLIVLSSGEHIAMEDLPSRVLPKPSKTGLHMPGGSWDLKEAIANLERGMILRALEVFGSQRKAAATLGIDQSTLARKAKRYNIGKHIHLKSY